MFVVPIVPHLLWFLVVIGMVMFISFRYLIKSRSSIFASRSELTRRVAYVEGLLFEKETAMESRVLRYGDYIQKLYEKEVIKVNSDMKRIIFKVGMISVTHEMLGYLFALSSYVFLYPSLLSDDISLGLYIAIGPALHRLAQAIIIFISQDLVTINDYRSFMKEIKLFDTLSSDITLNEVGLLNDAPEFQEIRFTDVWFKYPDTDVYIFKGLSMVFTTGHHYAIVGRNGAGKSTFVKLMLGIYKPNKGEITINGVHIDRMSVAQVQKIFSAVFQDSERFKIPLKDSITLGNHGLYDSGKLQEALVKSDFLQYMDQFEAQLDTQLGDLYEGGIDLSGGQWQKLAIARMFYADRSFLILDEPTSALDPISESKLYKTYLSIIKKQKTSLFITHRLGATTLCDIICVLEDGYFKQVGTHKALLRDTKGTYGEMFNGQRGLYV